MELQLRQHFGTHTEPFCSLHKAIKHLLYFIGTAPIMIRNQTQKCGNTASQCLDKPRSGQGGGAYAQGRLPRVRPRDIVSPWQAALSLIMGGGVEVRNFPTIFRNWI